jgi:hypothetical protein
MTIDAIPGPEDLPIPDAIALTRISGWRQCDRVLLPSGRFITGQRAYELSEELHAQRDGLR